jgi:hypothetical protein
LFGCNAIAFKLCQTPITLNRRQTSAAQVARLKILLKMSSMSAAGTPVAERTVAKPRRRRNRVTSTVGGVGGDLGVCVDVGSSGGSSSKCGASASASVRWKVDMQPGGSRTQCRVLPAGYTLAPSSHLAVGGAGPLDTEPPLSDEGE